MRLRTLTGTRWPARCADGCGQTIPASPDVRVVVDFDAHPRKTWIPEHSPDASSWASRSSGVGRVLPREPGPGPSVASAATGSLGPDAGTWKGIGPAASPAPSNGGIGHSTGFTPANALPAVPPTPPTPTAPPKAPPPAVPSVPLALLASTGSADATPNPSAGVPWATASLTFNAGSFESARAGLADYAQPGETCEQLRARISRLVLEDLERSVRAMRELHERLSDSSGGVGRVLPKGPGPSPPASLPSGGPFGGDTPRTLSPARAAGVPAASGGGGAPGSDAASLGARAPVLRTVPQDRGSSAPPAGAPATPSSPPRMIVPPATPAVEGASPGPSPQAVGAGPGPCKVPAQTPPDARPLKDLVHDVRLELSDASPLRLSRKEKVWVDWLQKRGYSSLQDVRVGDEWGLGRILDEFEAIDQRG